MCGSLATMEFFFASTPFNSGFEGDGFAVCVVGPTGGTYPILFTSASIFADEPRSDSFFEMFD